MSTWLSPHQARPRSALVAPKEEDEKPDCGKDEAEDRHKHHPGLGVYKGSRKLCGCYQDPYKSAKYLEKESERDGVENRIDG